mgnify:CR=1 FL=1
MQNSEKYKDKYSTKSSRLTGWDYSTDGAYFITICAKDHQCFFGRIINKKMHLNEIGKIAKKEWIKTAEIRNNIQLDEYVIMPNHIHGILWIYNNKPMATVETHCNASLHKNTIHV